MTHQPGVYLPLRALFLVLCENGIYMIFACGHTAVAS